MRLQVLGVDHDALRLWSFSRETCKDAVEHPHPAPAYDPAGIVRSTVEERLVGTVSLGRVLPLQAMLDDLDDSADHPPVVDPRHAVRKREKRRNPSHLALTQQKQTIH
jgi:hypothetical protein